MRRVRLLKDVNDGGRDRFATSVRDFVDKTAGWLIDNGFAEDATGAELFDAPRPGVPVQQQQQPQCRACCGWK